MSQLEEMLAESGLELDDELEAVLAPLAALATAPEPTGQLAAIFAGARLVGERASRRARVARAAAGAAVAAALGMSGTGLAAAANTLPAPLQHRVSDFSARFLPFRFPQPDRTVVPAPAPERHKGLPPAGDGGPDDKPGPLVATAARTARALRPQAPDPVPAAHVSTGPAPARRATAGAVVEGPEPSRVPQEETRDAQAAPAAPAAQDEPGQAPDAPDTDPVRVRLAVDDSSPAPTGDPAPERGESRDAEGVGAQGEDAADGGEAAEGSADARLGRLPTFAPGSPRVAPGSPPQDAAGEAEAPRTSLEDLD